jgi:hypothetical protein
MNLSDFRTEMYAFWAAAVDEALGLKDAYRSVERLGSFYRNLDQASRELADVVLAEWVLSEDEKLRFDALAVVDDFLVASALPALCQLAARLSSAGTPGAPFEIERVEGIVQRLTQVT